MTDGSDGKYHIQRTGIYSPYELTVSDLQYTDSGFYYCCLPANCSDNVQDNCQRFILSFSGKHLTIVDVHLSNYIILGLYSEPSSEEFDRGQSTRSNVPFISGLINTLMEIGFHSSFQKSAFEMNNANSN